MSSRRQGREFAVRFLYHLQFDSFQEQKSQLLASNNTQELKKQIDLLAREMQATIDIELDSKVYEFALELISGVIFHFNEIEEQLMKYTLNWKLSRLSKVDHTILILGAYEILHEKKTPANVVINEAIELAKLYGNKDSNSFVNGILDAMAKQNPH